MGLIHGVDSTDKVLPLLVDASGRALTLSHGWDGAAWRKDPVRLGYSGVVRYFVNNTALAAGTNVIVTTTVPVGQVNVITAIAMQYAGTVPTDMTARLKSGGVGFPINNIPTPVSTQYYTISGTWVVAEGEWLECEVRGATLNDDLFFRVHGYSFRVDT